eukprot:scaffold90111_cov54-Cyclotella_meneghiniana.AAC.5
MIMCLRCSPTSPSPPLPTLLTPFGFVLQISLCGVVLEVYFLDPDPSMASFVGPFLSNGNL